MPAAALLVLSFFERSTELSTSDYEATRDDGPWVKYGGPILDENTERQIEMPGLGNARFSKDVPPDIAAKVVTDFSNTHNSAVSELKPSQSRYEAEAPDGTLIYLIGATGASEDEVIRQAKLAKAFLDAQQNSSIRPTSDFQSVPGMDRDWFLQGPPQVWRFSVHKKVNKVKLAGLVAASLAISALIIQGLISVLAWVDRGFRG